MKRSDVKLKLRNMISFFNQLNKEQFKRLNASWQKGEIQEYEVNEKLYTITEVCELMEDMRSRGMEWSEIRKMIQDRPVLDTGQQSIF